MQRKNFFNALTKHPDGRIRVDDILNFTGGVQNVPIYWNQIQDKPSTYPPEPHTHLTIEDHKIFSHQFDIKRVNISFDVIDVLTIPIPEGYPGDSKGEVIHLDIFHKPEGKFGYPFWMAYSPYPNLSGSELYENPCIARSKDGINWEPIEDNPIIDPPGGSSNYNSDPCIFELDNGNLCVINRQVVDSNRIFQYTISGDGEHWSTPVNFATFGNNPDYKSPSVIKDSSCGDREFKFYVCADFGSLYVTKLTFNENYTSASLGNFTTCNVSGLDSGYYPGHVTVRYVNNQYVALLVTRSYYGPYRLYLATSDDGINFTARLLFDGYSLGSGFPYRSDFLLDKDGNLLLYLPYVLDSKPFVYLVKLSFTPNSTTTNTLLPPMASLSVFEVEDSGYSSGTVIRYFISSVDLYGRESYKWCAGRITSEAKNFYVVISIEEKSPAYKYRIYRYVEGSSDSIFDITDFKEVDSSLSNITDDNSDWSSLTEPFKVGSENALAYGISSNKDSIFISRKLVIGTESEQPIVVNSNSLCTNLNADLLDGKHASDFALASHMHYFGPVSFMPRPLGIDSYVVPYAIGGTVAAALSVPANRTYWIPVMVWYRLSLTAIAIYVTTASTREVQEIQVGVYNSSSTFSPNNRLFYTTFSTSSTGLKEQTLSNTTLNPGVYWFALAVQDSCGIRAIALASAQSLALPSLGTANTVCYYTTGTTLPSTAPTSGYSELTGSNVPAIGVKYSFST